MTTAETPYIEFYSIYRNVPLPSRASDDMMGTMPARAAQLCLPLKTGSGVGFYLYPPIDFALRWDGQRSEISWLDENAQLREWKPLDGGVDVHLPGADRVPTFVPEARSASLPSVMDETVGIAFINAHPRLQSDLEITTGVIARTPPGWGLLVRPIANPSTQPDHVVLDGYLETDWYRSFLPIVIRLSRPGTVVRFFRHVPMAQAIPIPLTSMHASSRTAGSSATGIGEWPDDIWAEFGHTRSERFDPNRQRGTYARASKRAAKNDRCPYDHSAEAAHEL